MNLIEKLLLNKALDPPQGPLKTGQVVRIKVDWILASELSWVGMDAVYTELGRPALARPDRFWIAADHRVDPRNMHEPRVQKILAHAERIVAEAPSIDYQKPNETIIHTEFYRERVQPGQIVIGSDSHTCSAGGLGAFAMGLGALDVTLPLLSGETWIEVPQVARINFVGRPPLGIGGKDVILYVLGELKRNTVAAERVVEFGGPGCRYLSADARFVISNMTTEFGGIAGVFVPDGISAAYLQRRKSPKHRREAMYFKPDPDAQYASSHEIDLGQISPLVALYPNPDDVYSAKDLEFQGTLDHLDGVFIGACTTTEEDLILAALVLEQGLKEGLNPIVKGHRKVTPGSTNIIARLDALGLIGVYKAAGFDVEPPGCSYCTGGAYAKAEEGEIWLSSQNRNFKNRMGKGAIGNISSATTVAASSFDMKLRDPTALLNKVDMVKYDSMRQVTAHDLPSPMYSEVKINHNPHSADPASDIGINPSPSVVDGSRAIRGKPYRMGDNVDTDAIIAVAFLSNQVSDEEFGSHCFEYSAPEARERFKAGYNIVVADSNFGCGSSREPAVNALKGAGVKAVIAKSYAYIFHRNCPNVPLLAVVITDPDFYKLVDSHPEAEIEINILRRSVTLDGRRFSFDLSPMELSFLLKGGALEAFKKGSAKVFSKTSSKGAPEIAVGEANSTSALSW